MPPTDKKSDLSYYLPHSCGESTWNQTIAKGIFVKVNLRISNGIRAQSSEFSFRVFTITLPVHANPNITMKIICQSISGAQRLFNYYQQRAKIKIAINFPIAGHTWIKKESRVIRVPQFDQTSCLWIGSLMLVFRFLCTPLERRKLTISFWTHRIYLILHDRKEINLCFHFCKSAKKQI